MGYYSANFENMNTSTIQLWLYEAQWQLPSAVGAVREMLLEGISNAATELLFRYREDMRQLT